MKKVELIELPKDWPVNPYSTLEMRILAIPVIGKWLAQNSTNASKVLIDERDQQILRWLKKQGIKTDKKRGINALNQQEMAQD
jgi:hypothetical protein